MKGLTVKIIGTKGFSPWKSKVAKKWTSCRFYWKKKSIQIDIGNPYKGKKVNKLLITHTHYDHVQDLKTCPKDIEVLVPSGTFIERLRKKNKWVEFRIFKEKTSLDGLSVKPFPVLHSKNTLTYGFKFYYKDKKIVWLPDYCIIPNYTKILNNIDILFLGAAALKKKIKHKGYGHCQESVYNYLKKIKDLDNPPEKIYLIHYGMGMRPVKIKGKYLQDEFPSLNIHLTKDNQKIRI